MEEKEMNKCDIIEKLRMDVEIPEIGRAHV